MNIVSTLRLVALLSLVGMSACTATIRLYPIEGPLSEEKPLPVFTAKAFGVEGGNGRIEMVGHEGERFAGEWSSAAGMDAGSFVLFLQYGTAIGSSVRPSPGQNPGRAFLIGDQGTTVDVEFVTGGGTANGFGVAKDSNGNVFRVLF